MIKTCKYKKNISKKRVFILYTSWIKYKDMEKNRLFSSQRKHKIKKSFTLRRNFYVFRIQQTKNIYLPGIHRNRSTTILCSRRNRKQKHWNQHRKHHTNCKPSKQTASYLQRPNRRKKSILHHELRMVTITFVIETKVTSQPYYLFSCENA